MLVTLLAVLITIALLGGGMISAGFMQNYPDLTSFTLAFLVSCLLVILAIAIFNTAIWGAQILVVASPKDSLSLTESFKGGFRLTIPLFLTVLLGGLLIFGGFFVFILPALLFGFLLSFSTYAVVLDGYSPINALRRSVGMISAHFGEVLIRVVVLWLIYFLVSGLIPEILRSINGNLNVLIKILSFIVDLVLGWYMLAYGVTMYQHLRGISDKEQGPLRWLVATSFIGWVLVVFLGIGIFGFVRSEGFKKFSDELLKPYVEKFQKGNKEFTPEQYLDFFNTQTPLETPSFPTSQSI